MESNISTSKPNYTVFIAVICTYSILVLTTFHYQRLTGDATLYLSIAEKYIRGDFANAVNGYWGPLLSWLLVPFLYFGASHVLAINSLNLILGLFTITGICKLSRWFNIDEKTRSFILLPLVPMLYLVSLIEPMDFLLLCVLTYYLNVVFRADYSEKTAYGFSAGLMGVLAYFSKPFGFPFFISHFLLINICHYFRDSSKKHRKKVVKNAVAGFIVFFLFSGIWIGLISSKYGYLTFSNQGRGVFASLGPGSDHGTLEKGDPIFYEGFFAPPNETAHVIYEDPSYAREKVWNPVDSRGAFSHLINNLSENIFEALRIYESFSRLSPAIIIAYILLLCYQTSKSFFMHGAILYPLITLTLFTGGYLPFHFETRYLWIISLLLLLMGGKVMSEMFKRDFFHKRSMRSILILLFILSFSVTPLKASLHIGNNSLNEKMYILGSELKQRYDIRGNIASNRQMIHTSVHDTWHQTFRLSYWLDSRYYGQAKANISEEDLIRELGESEIDYYFFWEGRKGRPEFLSQYREITEGTIPGLEIYSLNEKVIN